MITRLAWLTTAAARGRDDDEPLALAALAAAGVDVDVLDWDDEHVDWGRYDRAVLRSTWDYSQRLPKFLERLETIAAATELVNPLPVVGWNSDKRYLDELAAADHEAAAAHVRRLHDRGVAALVQPFVTSVGRDGEWPVIFLDGVLSHAAHKRITLPRADSVTDLFAREANRPHDPGPAQQAAARAALDVVTARFGTLPYARVDLVRIDGGSDGPDSDGGEYAVLELELIEPSLFLPQAHPSATQRLAAVLGRD